MRRLLAIAAVASAFAVSPAQAGHYDRQCGGIVDAECRGYWCVMDCFSGDCLVWLDPQHNPHTAQCLL